MSDAQRLFSVQQIPGKGLGCLAKVSLKRGQELVRERPLIQSPGKLKLSSPSPEAANNYFSRLVDEIPADKQAAFYNLSDWRSEQAGIPKQAYRIFLSNALPQGRGAESTGAGVYATLCRINHSCQPNCHFSWNSRQGEEVVHAVKDVRVGEELSVTYIEPFASRDARRRRLEDRFGFLCACPSCTAQGNDLKGSDEARERMAALDSQIRKESSEDRAMAGLEELLGLMEVEGISNTYFVARLCQAAAHNQGRPSRGGLGLTMAQMAVESFTTCEGAEGESTQAMRAWMSGGVAA